MFGDCRPFSPAPCRAVAANRWSGLWHLGSHSSLLKNIWSLSNSPSHLKTTSNPAKPNTFLIKKNLFGFDPLFLFFCDESLKVIHPLCSALDVLVSHPSSLFKIIFRLLSNISHRIYILTGAEHIPRLALAKGPR